MTISHPRRTVLPKLQAPRSGRVQACRLVPNYHNHRAPTAIEMSKWSVAGLKNKLPTPCPVFSWMRYQVPSRFHFSTPSFPSLFRRRSSEDAAPGGHSRSMQRPGSFVYAGFMREKSRTWLGIPCLVHHHGFCEGGPSNGTRKAPTSGRGADRPVLGVDALLYVFCSLSCLKVEQNTHHHTCLSPVPGAGPRTTAGRGFAAKFYDILSQESSDIITWTKSGQAFQVLDYTRFSEEILLKVGVFGCDTYTYPSSMNITPALWLL